VAARVVVVGLGPAGADLLLPAARTALERTSIRFARTARHPAIDDLRADGIEFEALDRCYDDATDLERAYTEIAERVLTAARASDSGDVVYAVPGSPTTAERTVAMVRTADDVDVDIVPGLSFADLALARLGLDPLTGVRVVDARSFATDAAGFAGPMLLAQCDNTFVCSDVKLALLEALPPDHYVTVLQRLGLPDENVFDVALAELDQRFEPDHLTSLFVDTGEVAVASEFARLVALAERLRGPGGCPWDAAQTHNSLRRHVLEEAYEVAEAIEELPVDAPAGEIPSLQVYDALEDELGDLLFQVVIHSVLAAETGAFTVADVVRRIHDKLIHRHPHVFGDVRVGSAAEVVTNWEQLKKEEQGHDSLVEGVTAGLPALLSVQKLMRKASSIGLDAAIASSPAPTTVASAPEGLDEQGLGDALAAIAAAGARHGIDAESALAGWVRRFKDRFQRMEAIARDEGVDLPTADPATTRTLWERAAR
jgi:tetrapyrrole methylase family protein/MazG family protein